MKKSPQILYVFLFTIGISAAIVAGFIRPGYKYKLDIHEKYSMTGRSFRTYSDLNGDEKTELLTMHHLTSNTSSIIVYNSEGKIFDQFNFRGDFPERTEFIFGDYDTDSLKEVYLFTYVGDSLFLNIFEPYSEDKPLMCRVFIDIAPLEEGEASYQIHGFLDNSNTSENGTLYFSVFAGLTLNPRCVYSYDIENDELNKSGFSGNSIIHNLSACDIDNDGTIELFGEIGAPGNYHHPVPYSDQSTWLMIYSHDLGYEFTPVEFEEYPATISSFPIIDEEENKWFVKYQYRGTRKDLYNELMTFSIDGKLLNTVNLDSIGFKWPSVSFVINNSIYVHDSELGLLMSFDKNLKPEQRTQSEYLAGGLFGPYNLGPDKQQILLITNNNLTSIVDLKGRKLTEESFVGTALYSNRTIIAINYKGFSGYNLKTREDDYLFNLEKRNKWLWFSLKVSGVFIIVFWTVFLLQYFQIRQDNRRRIINHKLREYQLIAIKKQIDPHFIFNALNAIASMNLKGNAEEADEYLVRFSDLMREVLDSSGENIVPLSSELKLLERYLSLEQLRFGSDFNYTIDVPADCLEFQVPSMSVHTFVENAIKHGLSPKEGKKLLTVRASEQDNLMKIEIEDNGVGFSPKTRSFYSTGKGYEIVRKMFFAFHELTGKKISYIRSEAPSGGVLITMTVETK